MAFVLPKAIQLSSFEIALDRMSEDNYSIEQKYKDVGNALNEDISNLKILPELQMNIYSNILKDILPEIDLIDQNKKKHIKEYISNQIQFQKDDKNSDNQTDQNKINSFNGLTNIKSSNISDLSSNYNQQLLSIKNPQQINVNGVSNMKLRRLSYAYDQNMITSSKNLQPSIKSFSNITKNESNEINESSQNDSKTETIDDDQSISDQNGN